MLGESRDSESVDMCVCRKNGRGKAHEKGATYVFHSCVGTVQRLSSKSEEMSRETTKPCWMSWDRRKQLATGGIT